MMAHGNGKTQWHNLDSKTMLLAVWVGFGLLLNELFDNTSRGAELRGYSRDVRNFAHSCVWALTLGIYWWLAETNSAIGPEQEVGERLGAVVTAIPLGLGVIAGLCMTKFCQRVPIQAMGELAFRTARCRFLFGFAIALFAVCVWIPTENLCDRTDAVGTFFKWLPGHTVWHVCMAYGLTQALLFAGALRADDVVATVRIDTGTPRTILRFYFFLFPRLILTPMSEPCRSVAIHPESTPAAASASLQSGSGAKGEEP